MLRIPLRPAAFALAAAATALAFALPDSVTSPAMIQPAHAEAATSSSLAAPLPRPEGHREVSRRSVTVDGERAVLARFERIDGRHAGPGGEHVSTVVDETGRLKGFTRMSADLLGQTLPTETEARAVARRFLEAHAPDLLSGLEEHWIARHDEPLRVSRNGRTEDATLSGMKVKMRNTVDGRWFWVIVGADREAMVFERDIVWRAGRVTEKWLHDAWLVENDLVATAS